MNQRRIATRLSLMVAALTIIVSTCQKSALE